MLKYQELQTKTIKELEVMLEQCYKTLMNLRFQKSSRELTDTSSLKKARKDLARVKASIVEKTKSKVN